MMEWVDGKRKNWTCVFDKATLAKEEEHLKASKEQ